jgi:hypothetical protein
MQVKHLAVATAGLLATSIAGWQSIGAHPSGKEYPPAVGVASTGGSNDMPDPGESFRITFYNNGTLPKVEGVSLDALTKVRYWSGPQEPGTEGKAPEEFHKEGSEVVVRIYDDLRFNADHPPYNTHCHKWVYIPQAVLVHC